MQQHFNKVAFGKVLALHDSNVSLKNIELVKNERIAEVSVKKEGLQLR
jgi:hypothetical protein